MPSAAPHPPPGTVIAGKYELEGLLGEGGMGAVYQATNLAIGRRVAIKILHAAVAERDDIRQRFELEARAAAVINHPGIVDVLDMGQTDEGDPFIVMEHLEGMTLRSIVKELKTLPPEQAVGVMIPVLDALSAAHKAGVIHRDVKPANIFICARPQVVKLLDFGVSRFGRSTGLTLTGAAIGTPRYMAPEQVLGEPEIGPETDLYSVGAVLYSMLSGRLPHGSGSDLALLARALHDTPPPLVSVTTGLPAPLCELVDALLLKDRGKRPKDALKVRDALAHAVPNTELAALFTMAQRTARAAALSPTPSGSASGLKKTSASRPSPRPSSSGAATRASGVSRKARHEVADEAPPPRQGLPVAALFGGALAVALVVGGVVAFVVRDDAPPEKPVVVATPPPPPAAPKSVTVTLVAEPAGAQITAGGVALTCNPCPLSGAAGTRQPVRVAAPGMTEVALEVLFDQDRTEKIVLVAAPLAAAPVEIDAGAAPTPVKRPTKKPKGLSVDETNPYQ